MPTYADLKTRIITETVRDDLAGDLATTLATHIARAVEYYASTRFWFNTILASAMTTPGTATVDIPATVRIVDRAAYPNGFGDINEYQLVELPDDGSTGRPTRYAYYNDKLRLWPTPDGAYTLNIYGVAQIAGPTADGDTNVWTNQAYDLITAQTKMTLYRGIFRDPEGAQLAMAEVQDALARLKRETARRVQSPLRSDFQIARGWLNPLAT